MRRIATVVLVVACLTAGYFAGNNHLLASRAAVAADECQTFAQTGKQVCGRFLEYWRANGGLAQQGLALSEEMQEKSDIDGKTYKVQYFERAVFEYHPENQRPYDVLLSLLGREKYALRYPNGPTIVKPGEYPLAVGLQLTLKDDYNANATFKAVVTKVEQSKDLIAPGMTKPSDHARGKYVVVTMDVTNTGTESGSPGTSGMKLKDEQGRRFDIASQYGAPVQPSLTVTKTYWWDVAENAQQFILIIGN